MKLSVTERPRIADLKTAVKRMFRRACEDLGVSLHEIGDELGLSESRVQRWVDPHQDAQAPWWILADRRAVPEALYQRVLVGIEALRSQQPEGLEVPLGGAIAVFVMRAAGALEEIARAWADGRITSLEVPRVRQRLADLIAQAEKLMRMLDNNANVVAIAGAK